MDAVTWRAFFVESKIGKGAQIHLNLPYLLEVT